MEVTTITGMLMTEELLAVITAEREGELERLSSVRQARGSLKAAAKRRRAWTWRVEPGMEEAFKSLRSWLLSSLQDSEVEQANTHDGRS
jgi:hypothetical protein